MQRVLWFAKHTFKREVGCVLRWKTPVMHLESPGILSNIQSPVVCGLHTSPSARSQEDDDSTCYSRKEVPHVKYTGKIVSELLGSGSRAKNFKIGSFTKVLLPCGALAMDFGCTYLVLKALHGVYSSGSFSGEVLDQETMQAIGGDMLVEGVGLGDLRVPTDLLTALTASITGVLGNFSGAGVNTDIDVSSVAASSVLTTLVTQHIRVDSLKNAVCKLPLLKAVEGYKNISGKLDQAIQKAIRDNEQFLSSVVNKTKEEASFTREANASKKNRTKNISLKIKLTEKQLRELAIKITNELKTRPEIKFIIAVTNNPLVRKSTQIVLDSFLKVIISTLISEQINQQSNCDNTPPNDFSSTDTSSQSQGSENSTEKVPKEENQS